MPVPPPPAATTMMMIACISLLHCGLYPRACVSACAGPRCPSPLRRSIKTARDSRRRTRRGNTRRAPSLGVDVRRALLSPSARMKPCKQSPPACSPLALACCQPGSSSPPSLQLLLVLAVFPGRCDRRCLTVCHHQHSRRCAAKVSRVICLLRWSRLPLHSRPLHHELVPQ